jgi:uncharacterized protein HemX
MTETGSSWKAKWWREVLIVSVVAFVGSAYYGAKQSQAERRAEQAEARLKQMEASSEAENYEGPALEQVKEYVQRLGHYCVIFEPIGEKAYLRCVSKTPPKQDGTPPPPPGNNPVLGFSTNSLLYGLLILSLAGLAAGFLHVLKRLDSADKLLIALAERGSDVFHDLRKLQADFNIMFGDEVERRRNAPADAAIHKSDPN